MRLGMIGLGRMGGNMVRRLLRKGHECVVFDNNLQMVQTLAALASSILPALAKVSTLVTSVQTSSAIPAQ